MTEPIAGHRPLQTHILSELEELDRAQAAVQRHWQASWHATEPEVFINSVALNLCCFYAGLERLFNRIAARIDGGTLTDDNCNDELLRQMALAVPGLRPAVLSRESAALLDELRRFRHVVHTIPAANLIPRQMQPMVETLPDLWADVRRQLETFAAYLDALSRADENNRTNA